MFVVVRSLKWFTEKVGGLRLYGGGWESSFLVVSALVTGLGFRGLNPI